ncbi:MAG: polysulfide reductase chain C [Armatimonadota bacterium]|nr:MAG: polysulfide reductase chain C [Armatimonadota bacterium]
MTEQAIEQHHRLERDILAAMSQPTGWYWVALGVSIAAFLMGMGLWLYMILTGMGVAGINNPVGWGVFIVDFVFWVGIAHSGTLISAVLFLFRARFRSRFNRAAEAMTIFAVMTAGLFPLIHLGRVWFAYWLFPYPNNHLIWPNFKSPLVWDVFAVSTYLTVSAVFWYVGLIPDLAIARRHAKSKIQMWAYRVFSLGWVGSVQQWKHYNKLYGLLACFATPLVVSVHSVVSWDFAMSVIPGWHTTIFAPYFVAGAILSGCAMVITLMVPMRKIFRLEQIITVKHFEGIAQMLLLTSLIVTYSYIVEYAIAFYSGNTYEISHFVYRLLGAEEPGHYRYAYWVMVACNSVIPLLLFFRKVRTRIPALFVMSLFVNVGMWLERFIIIVTSLARDFDPYAWGLYKPSLVEVGITIGSFGLFFTLFLLFCKTLPVLAITEIKEEYT